MIFLVSYFRVQWETYAFDIVEVNLNHFCVDFEAVTKLKSKQASIIGAYWVQKGYKQVSFNITAKNNEF